MILLCLRILTQVHQELLLVRTVLSGDYEINMVVFSLPWPF